MNRGLPVFEPASGLDPWCCPKGSWALEKGLNKNVDDARTATEVLWRHQARSNEENIRLPVTDGNDLVAKIADILSGEFNVNK